MIGTDSISQLNLFSFKFAVKKFIVLNCQLLIISARMVELVDTPGSGSGPCKWVGVRVPLRAQSKIIYRRDFQTFLLYQN